VNELQALVERSRKPGTFVARRRFTLSRSRAVEKLREFTLRDPHQYVLELIQAAVFAGAESVAIDVDAGSLLFAWVGGTALRQEEAGRVFDYLFADRSAPGTRHLAQLAVGVNAVLQKRPRYVRIESGDGTREGTLRVELDSAGEGSLGVVSAPIRGTYLRVGFRRGLGSLMGPTLPPEQALIEERCFYTPIPILLNGAAPFGHFPDRGLTLFSVRDQIIFDDGARRGVLGVPIGSDSHRFRVVVGGVWVTTLELPELGSVANNDWEAQSFREPFIGVLCDDELNKTADQSDVVRDARFGALLGVLRPIADALAARVSRRGTPLSGRAAPRPDGVTLLGARGWMSREALAALPADEPLFRVDPSLTAWLSGPADPARFPFRVLVLSPEEAAEVEAALPEHAVHPLETPEQIDFVRRVLEAERPAHEISLPVMLETPVPMDGVLTMRLHRDGGTPGWGPPGGGTPALLVHAGRSEWAGGLAVSLPGVSVRFEADALARVPGESLVRALTAEATAAAARLVPEGAVTAEERRLGQAILSAGTRPRRAPDGRIYAALDERWGELSRLRDAPLLLGGVSLSEWLAGAAGAAGSPPGMPGWMDGGALEPSEEEQLANLTDPKHPGWALREPVSFPGIGGWIGLADPYDARGAVLLVGGPAQSESLALPCRGLLRVTGRGGLSPAQGARLRAAVTRLHQRLDGPGVDAALARRYRARFEAARRATVEVALPNPAAELSRRLDRALQDAPGQRVLRLTLESGDGPPVAVDAALSQGNLVRVRLNTRHDLVRRAQLPGEAREVVLLEALRRVCVWLDAQGHPVDFLEAQQALTALSPME